MADEVENLIALYKSNRERLTSLLDSLEHYRNRIPEAVSSKLEMNAVAYESQMQQTRKALVENGVDENSLGFDPISWGLVLGAVMLGAGAVVGVGGYYWYKVEMKRMQVLEKRIAQDQYIINKYGADYLLKLREAEKDKGTTIQIGPGGAGGGLGLSLGAALAVAVGIYLLVKS